MRGFASPPIRSGPALRPPEHATALALCHHDRSYVPIPAGSDRLILFQFFQAPRPSTGPHKLRECLPLLVILRDRLKYALTGHEAMMILKQRQVLVDARVRTDNTFPAGFMGKSSRLRGRRIMAAGASCSRSAGEHRGAAAWDAGCQTRRRSTRRADGSDAIHASLAAAPLD